MPDSPADATQLNSAIVVGGGLAGISAALALAKADVQVTLLESKRRLGGRAGSFSDPRAKGSDVPIDYCQHVGMGCCKNLQQLIAWLGQDQAWQRQRELHFYGPSGDYQRLAALPGLPAPFHLTPWLFRWPGLRFRDRLAVAYGLLKIRKLVLDDSLDSFSADQWLRENRQTSVARERFWSTIITSALGEELTNVSLYAVCKVLQDGFLNERDAFHLLVPQRPLDEIFNQAAYRVLKTHGVDVQLASPVSRIVRSEPNTSKPSGRSATPCSQFDVYSSQRCFSGQAVILAIPWHQIDQVEIHCDHPTNEFQIGKQLNPSPITGIHTWWDRPWMDTPSAAIVGRLCQWVFPKFDETPIRQSVSDARVSNQGQIKSGPTNDSEQYYQIVISASRDLPRSTQGELAEAIHDDLACVFPKVREARLLRMKTVTDPLAVFSVAPGANRLRPGSSAGIPNFRLAGDWTDTGWPATMEGAILSGFQAAEELLSDRSAAEAHPNQSPRPNQLKGSK